MVSVIIQDVLVVGCVGGSEKRSRIQPVGGGCKISSSSSPWCYVGQSVSESEGEMENS